MLEKVSLKQSIILLSALAFLMVSAISAAYSVHLTRQHVGKLSELNQQQNGLELEWEKLLLELNMLAGYNRIEATAIKKLNMQAPKPEQLRIIELKDAPKRKKTERGN